MTPRAEEQESRRVADVGFTSEDLIDAVDRAVRAALRRHKERGESVVMWRDGRVVWVRPEEIDV